MVAPSKRERAAHRDRPKRLIPAAGAPGQHHGYDGASTLKGADSITASPWSHQRRSTDADDIDFEIRG
jgi:hypothetical protein